MDRARLERLIGRNGVTLTESEWSDVYDLPIRALLTPADSNPKIAKGLKLKRPVSTAILHLMPAEGSGVQVCPKATAGCRAACLNTAGRGGMALDSNGLNTIQRARRRRTLQYFARREEFTAQLAHEIALHIKRAKAKGFIPAVRLNGTSDLLWEKIPVTHNGVRYANLMEAFSKVQFYDYTKRTDRENLPSNYHLTFSLADGNDRDAKRMLKQGVNVAVVIRTPLIAHFNGVSRFASKVPMPATFKNLPLIDGDKSDVRFADPDSGVYVGLRAKGRAVKDASGFVRDIRDACEVPSV